MQEPPGLSKKDRYALSFKFLRCISEIGNIQNCSAGFHCFMRHKTGNGESSRHPGMNRGQGVVICRFAKIVYQELVGCHMAIGQSVILFRQTGTLFCLNGRKAVPLSRIRTATELLLNTDFSLDEIAAKTGFCDAAHFSACFKKQIGNPPSVYRKG